MNWDAIGAGSEILAAIGVIVSLLYLAQQIRQSALASIVAINQGIADSFRGINELVASSPDLADIIVRGSASLDQLSLPEALRFGSAMTNFFNIIEHQHRQLVASGRFDRATSSMMRAVVRKRLAFPGVEEWWKQNTDDFDAEFVQWVESLGTASSPDQGRGMVLGEGTEESR